MDDSHARHAFDDELRRLEQRVVELAALCERMREENRGLRQSQDALANERANLLARHDQVRARVEAMIDRLKGLEQTA
jgi:cell division protein ZapB